MLEKNITYWQKKIGEAEENLAASYLMEEAITKFKNTQIKFIAHLISKKISVTTGFYQLVNSTSEDEPPFNGLVFYYTTEGVKELKNIHELFLSYIHESIFLKSEQLDTRGLPTTGLLIKGYGLPVYAKIQDNRQMNITIRITNNCPEKLFTKEQLSSFREKSRLEKEMSNSYSLPVKKL